MESWKTKPTDRFVLRWIKCHLSARITPRLVGVAWLRPWMITVGSSSLGVLAGAAFALGHGFSAGLLACAGQVLDGVDGQFARLTGRASPRGAFLDSTLDRYADMSLTIGMCVYLYRLPASIPAWQLLLLGALALTGGTLVSYTKARGDSLGIEVESAPTLASKGTRTTVMALCALLTPLWPGLPLVALLYLAVHPQAVVAGRLLRVMRQGDRTGGTR